MNKWTLTATIPLLVIVFLGCAQTAMNKEYEHIKNSSLSGKELLNALTEFELHNTSHFSSKIDLANYYMLNFDYDVAKQYLIRAESIISKAPKTEEGEKLISILYGSLAHINLYQGDYAKADEYAQKAVNSHKTYGKVYKFTQAHILLAQNKKDKALDLFKSLFSTQENDANTDDLRAYMYLLADNNETQECIKILEQYFASGNYFSGLGLFASSIYEDFGDIDKSIFSAYLDYEFTADYEEPNKDNLLNNLDVLESQLMGTEHFEEAHRAIVLIRSLYDSTITTSIIEQPAFFPVEYIFLKKKIRDKKITESDFNQLLLLEQYFLRFQSYYWNVWQAIILLTPESKSNFLPVLDKIINLNKSNTYANLAWKEITDVMGFSEK